MSGPSQHVQVYVERRGNGLAVTALVFGSLAIVTSCLPILPWILAVLGICFGGAAILVAAMRGGDGLGMAVGGLILCLLSLLPIMLLGVLLTTLVAPDATEQSKQEAEKRDRHPAAWPAASAVDVPAQPEGPEAPESEATMPPGDEPPETPTSPEVTGQTMPEVTGPTMPSDPATPGFPASTRYRTWTDASGQFSVEAEFGGVAFGKVKLKKADGTTVVVPLERLSAQDQEWIRGRGR